MDSDNTQGCHDRQSARKIRGYAYGNDAKWPPRPCDLKLFFILAYLKLEVYAKQLQTSDARKVNIQPFRKFSRRIKSRKIGHSEYYHKIIYEKSSQYFTYLCLYIHLKNLLLKNSLATTFKILELQ